MNIWRKSGQKSKKLKDGIDMLKGCQKRVIWVRNPESKWFDEAYFILSDSPEHEEKTSKENDMLKEANKIIAASPFASYYGFSAPISKKSDKIKFTDKLKWFLIGAFLSALLITIAFILI